MGFFDRLKQGLSRTREALVDRVQNVFAAFHKIDENLFEQLEEVLIEADVGVETALDLIEGLRQTARGQRLEQPAQLLSVLKEQVQRILGISAGLEPAAAPRVILVVGVNGVGKTTTIGKLAGLLHKEGEKVILAAGDTFRAAAADQLLIWGRRAGAEVIHGVEGSDPAAVAFDALQAAKSRRADTLIVDTAGRLHNKANLMAELGKMTRVLARELPGAPHEVLLVVDATTGQNAVQQARLFREVAGVTGVVLTKLDGTAKGGVVIAIRHQLGLPVKFVGVGEGIDDLQAFDPAAFADALFG